VRPKYPMLLDVRDRPIVIIGGGTVAARKAAGLIAAGATDVRVVAPEFRCEFDRTVRRVAEPYRPAHLDDAALVFAATDSAEVNQAVVRDAHDRGLLVCRADSDDDAPGDFVTPATAWRGPVQVTVSAGSAALSALVRDELLERWDDGWTRLAEAMEVIRPGVLASPGIDGAARKAIFRSLATREAVEIARSGGAEALMRWLDGRHSESAGDSKAVGT